jgi:Tfp pilus assembly protein PilF
MFPLENYINVALWYLSVEDYSNAIDVFSFVIDLDSDHSGAYYGRGIAYAMMDQKDDACMDFTKAKRLGVDHAGELLNKYCNKTDST